MKRINHSIYPVTALTHPGMKGKNNEDSFGVAAFRQDSINLRPVLLAVLCDGIGGHQAGEVASHLAVETVSREIERSDYVNPPEILREALRKASRDIYDRAQESPRQAGMGATCVCAWFIGDRLYAASVGDSRLYLLRGGSIRRLTTDHTWIQEALDSGVLKPEQVEGHPNQHVIRRYLGSPSSPEVDLRLRLSDEEDDLQAEANQGLRLLPGDLLLLTSDGLTDLVNDAEIESAFASVSTLRSQKPKAGMEQAGHALIELANSRGGYDNITLVAVSVPAFPSEHHSRLRRWAVRNWPWGLGGCAGLALAVMLGTAIIGGWFTNKGQDPTLTPSSTQAQQSGTPFASPTTRPSPGGQLYTHTPTPAPADLFPLEGGATLTPWPTNTPSP